MMKMAGWYMIQQLNINVRYVSMVKVSKMENVLFVVNKCRQATPE